MLARPHPLKRLSRALHSPTTRWEWVFFAVSAFALLLSVGYFQVKLTEPASLTRDHLFLLASAKSLIKGYGLRFDPLLGYPEPRDWLYFPDFDKTYKFVTWIAARLTTSPFVVVHIFYVTGLTAMACAYYWALRRLGISAWLAVIGSLAAALTPFLEERTYFHDALALSFSVPLGFSLALQLGRDGATVTLRSFFKDPLVLLSILIIGTSGLYYAFYSVLIAVFVGVTVSIGERRVFPLVAALLIAEVVLVLLVLSGYGLDFRSVVPTSGGGGTPQPQRYAFEQLAYGLNLAGAADRFTFLQKVATGVADTQRLTPIFQGDRGAWPALPLTLTILAAPFVCAAGQVRLRTLQGPAAPKLRLAVLCATVVTFLVLFGARGGLGYLFNLLAMPQIRSDARVMPFLAFGAVVVLCLFAEMARDSDRRWLRWAGPAAVGVVLIAGAAGSAGLAARLQSATLEAPKVKALRASLQGMLAAKDRAKLQTVLELPVLPWPEVLWLDQGYSPYEEQLPYIFDRLGSTTRWSYGADEKQPGFKRLQAQTARLDGLAERARRMGFDAVLIEKRAYDPNTLAAVEAAVGARAGPQCRLYEDQTYALYALGCATGAPRG
jgi:phosphoglycerol transferase